MMIHKATKRHNDQFITNSVTINFVANAQLAVGGSAAMVYLPDEGEFLANAGGATYINVGTLMPIYEKTLPPYGKGPLRTRKTLGTGPRCHRNRRTGEQSF